MTFSKSDYPDYTVKITPAGTTMSVHYGDLELARSKGALLLEETGHAKVYYFPMEDVNTNALTANQHSSHCPLKGDASYWDMVTEDTTEENLAWSYKNPITEAEAIAGYLAFYQDRVKVTAE